MMSPFNDVIGHAVRCQELQRDFEENRQKRHADYEARRHRDDMADRVARAQQSEQHDAAIDTRKVFTIH